MDLQPTLNIGVLGCVSHGKTQTVKMLTGVNTAKFKKEKKQNITIKLGYANAQFANKHVSFIDCPGHNAYMSTMISGIAIFDAIILLIAANEKCPQYQTTQHINALKIISNKLNPKNIIILQNKIDVVSKERCIENYNEIKQSVKGTIAEFAPIIPISAIREFNKDKVIEHICLFEESVKSVESDKSASIMYVIRSFNVNKPMTDPEDLIGGILGGSIIQGTFKLDDVIYINGSMKTKINSLYTGEIPLKYAKKGGLIGVGTTLDPTLTKNDGMSGYIVSTNEIIENYEMLDEIKVYFSLFERSQLDCWKKEENVVVNIELSRVIGVITKVRENYIKIKLNIPVFASKNSIIVISRRFENKWILYAYGYISGFPSIFLFNNIDKIDNSFNDYLKMYSAFTDKVKKQTTVLPVPIISRGTNYVVFENFGKLCEMINRDKLHVHEFIMYELGTTISYNGDGQLVIRELFAPKRIQTIVANYCNMFVLCKMCKGLDTSVIKEDRQTILQCNTCHASRSLDKIEKGYHAVKRGERRAG